LGAPKAGALPETHHNFGGRRSVGVFSPFAFFLSQSHGEHGGVSEFQIFRVSAFSATTSPSVLEISSQFRHTPPSVRASARSVPPQIFQESS
jgi:hypothetical protein